MKTGKSKWNLVLAATVLSLSAVGCGKSPVPSMVDDLKSTESNLKAQGCSYTRDLERIRLTCGTIDLARLRSDTSKSYQTTIEAKHSALIEFSKSADELIQYSNEDEIEEAGVNLRELQARKQLADRIASLLNEALEEA